LELLSIAYWQELALKYGAYALALNAFVEAVFFPIPPDVILLALCFSNPESSFFYAAVAT
jgi:membrane protein YqaA with SNARE-associated domain